MTTKATSASASKATGDKPTASFWSLALGSIGVVYGDIGTSPLYAFREATVAAIGASGAVTQTAVLGVLSLIVWALILVVTIKYVFILLYADNNGEGGTMALMALTQRVLGKSAVLPLALGLLGAGLFYGDAMITPAISVLSAVEGLKIVTPVFEPYVVPLTVAILVGLFAVQSRGTASVARYFGPITAAWFVAIAVAGLVHIADNPGVLAALNPLHAVTFLASHGMIGLVTLSAVFLAVTGAEALYADLGHFGRRPIQAAWLSLVLPALVINYFGQGALVLANPQALANPFFLLVPGWALPPMVMLATAATVIASQAVITGAFSLSSQAVQLGLLPRLAIRHTSAAQAGQIYMPRVNTILFVGVLLLVVMFASSSALASAYGVAVTGTMVVTAIMAFLVIWRAWRWSPWIAGALMGPLLLLDLTFLAANLLKVFHGGWVSLLIGTLVMAIMLTWRRGARLLMQKTRRLETPLKDLAIKLDRKPPTRIAGTAVFLTSDPESAPTALLHSLKHYKVLHERNVILTVATEDIPRVAPDERIRIEPVSKSFTRVLLRFGFMESPDVQRALTLARKHGLTLEPMSTSYFLSRRTLVQDPRSKLPAWQDGLFMLLARNADDASNYFRLPTNRVVEIGTQIAI